VRLLAALALLAILVWPSWASAAPSDELERARDAFQRGDYPTAIPLLTYLLYPSPRLSERAELAEAHLLLGVAHFESHNLEDARVEFDRALAQDQDLRLDPLLFSAEAVTSFEERQEQFKKRAEIDAEIRRLAEQREALRQAFVIERRPYYINFVPFGAGQFQNNQNGKGLFFSVSQGITGATSLAIFGYHAIKYDFNGKVPRDDAAGVRRLQQVQVAAGLACLGLMAWGIIDSLMNHEPTTQLTADEILGPHKRGRRQRAPRQRGPREPSSLRLLPVPNPGGAGLSLSFDF
jgi:tetratricopeptide (TPR) repeat protein